MLSTPRPGSGESYIHLLDETVSVVNGSLSLRIHMPMPQDRAINMPFGIRYDTNGVIVYDSSSKASEYHYLASPLADGWSYMIPQLTSQQVIGTTTGNGGNQVDCPYETDFVFTTATGERHSLGMQDLDSVPDPACLTFEDPNGGDLYYQIGSDRIVHDSLGNDYIFNANFNGSWGPAVEDRNGNIVYFPLINGSLGGFNMFDTTGRKAVSASSFGDVYNGDTVTIAGLSQPYKISWTGATPTVTLPVQLYNGGTPFNATITPTSTGPLAVISDLQLPDQTHYHFDYGNYGLLSKITYPSGAWVAYDWGTNQASEVSWYCFPGRVILSHGVPLIPGGCAALRISSPVVVGRTVSFDGQHAALHQDFSYSTGGWQTQIVGNDPLAWWTTKSTAITTTDYVTGQVSSEVHSYSALANSNDTVGNMIPHEVSVSYRDGSGHVLRTVNKVWDPYAQDMELQSVETVLENGLASKTVFGPHEFGGAPDSIQNFDYGETTSIRKTVTSYQTMTAPVGCCVNNTTVLPSTVAVYDGGGSPVAATVYCYDQQATSSKSGIPGHDDSDYGTSQSVRGNLTQELEWINPPGGSNPIPTAANCGQGGTAAQRSTTYSYDQTGQVVSTTDPLGRTTTFDYTDHFSDTAPAQQTNAYVTKITYPQTGNVSHVEKFAYAYSDGQLTQSVDQNSNPTSYVYNDVLGRLTETDLPGGGQTTIAYDDVNLKVTTTKRINSSINEVSTVVMDGMGHIIQTQLNSDPSGVDLTDTIYDGFGRPASVSNPYRSTSDPTFGITSFAYDALGRTTDVIKPDSGIVHTGYNGNVTVVTDEAGHSKQSKVDALNRLIELDEPPPSSGLGTPGSVARASGSINGYVQIDRKVLSAVQQTINAFLLDNSAASASSSAASTSASMAQPASASHQPEQPLPATPASPLPSPAPLSAGGTLTASSATANPNYDSGKVWITVKGFTAMAYYQAGSTAASVASDLASQFNNLQSGSPVSAVADGTGNLTLLARAPGSAGNFRIDNQGVQSNNPGQFPTSFTISMSVSGGSSASPGGLSSPMATLYQYSALGNLLRVDQQGTAPNDSTQWRTRTFAYDSLSRLITGNNPESGQIGYQYDANDNLLQKTSAAPNSPVGSGAVQTISYCYDSVNRVTGKAYSAQNCTNGQLPSGTAAVSYFYDAGTNGIGHLTSLSDQAGSGNYTYDFMGRIAGEQRTINGVSKSMRYGYNLDSSINSVTYPSNAVVTYTPDAAGRMVSAVDSGNIVNYVTGATYDAGSALTGFVSGNRITSTFTYNNRLQPVTMQTFPSVFAMAYDFHLGNGNNDNVYGITNYRDQTRNQVFSYDSLNRLISAQNAGTDCSVTLPGGQTKFWGNSYGYDAWGNLLSKTPTKCGGEHLSVTATLKNQLVGYGYDAAGNMTTDPTDGVTAVYDPENRISTATKNNIATTYTYDADGNRVEKSSAGTGTLYWYMAPGVVAESDPIGNLKSEYVFFNGQRVARRDFPSGAVSYYFSDRLKTTDIVTDAQGNIKNESDFYPWGGELQFLANDSNHYKFTGKERDSETGLDYFGARYYSNGLGRFITPDWGSKPTTVPYAHFGNPQTLNLYSYVKNNPTTLGDLDGHAGAAAAAGTVWDFVSRGSSIVRVLGTVASTLIPAAVGGIVVTAEINYAAHTNQIRADATMMEIHASNQLIMAKAAAPGKGSPAPGTQTAADKKPVKPYETGPFNDLKRRSVPGDKLDVHHVPQAGQAEQIIPGYDKNTAPAITIPDDEHQTIPTMKGDAVLTPEEQIQKDIQDLRDYTKAPWDAIKEAAENAQKALPKNQQD
jgi:RHS repeat-associated protein